MSKELKKPDEIDSIRNDLKTLSTNLESLRKHVKAEGKTTAADLKIKAKDNLSDLKIGAQKNIAQLKDYSKENLVTLEAEIKKKPAQSIAIAFGAGLLASFLLSRRG